MRRRRFAFSLVACCLFSGLAGCQCWKTTARYSYAVDRFADTKLALDPLYSPCLDISRTGMPDWKRCAVNRMLCPCARNCRCSKCRSEGKIFYPAKYRVKYWNHLAEKEAAEQEASMEGELAPPPAADVETAPEYVPEPAEMELDDDAPELIPAPASEEEADEQTESPEE